jgi:hypothetical protein
VPMASIVMVRTVCCESYKEFGRRCSLCPHRPENQQALREFQSEAANASRACRFSSHNTAESMIEIRTPATGDKATL